MISQEHSIKKIIKVLRSWDDEKYLSDYHNRDHRDILEKLYYQRTGKILNVDNPILYNEKLQWLKLYWRDEKACQYADKYTMREIVKRNIGDQHLNELVDRWTNVYSFDVNKLLTPCILKASHASGFNIVITDKAEVNNEMLREILGEILSIHYFAPKCEWVYENSEPSIICEKLYQKETDEKIDYKLYCFNGKVRMIHVLNAIDSNKKGVDPKAYFLDKGGEPFDFEYGYENEIGRVFIPDLSEMISIAEIFASEFPHLRVDLYKMNSEIHVGEFTFFPGSGYDEFRPGSYDKMVGSWLELPK